MLLLSIKNLIRAKHIHALYTFTLSLLLVSTLYAHPHNIPDIAQSPLELTPTVPPNVMLLLDDSGSMDFEVMTSDALSAGLFFGPNPEGSNFGSTDSELQITHRTGCELKASAFGGYAYNVDVSTNHYQDSSGNHCYVADAKAWRFRCSSYNKLYYDPTVNYQPWFGFRNDGAAFANVPANAAPLDPYLANSPTIDLTNPDVVATGIDKFRVYQCERNATSGNFENLSADPIEGEVISDMQNFANWFSYHRSRHLRAKALLGEFIINQVETRIGLVRFNFTSSPSLEAEEMNANAEDVGAKRNLLDALYSTSPQQLAPIFSNEESPLHVRYIETANYLAGLSSDVFPSGVENPAEDAPAGACQPNHIIVASDGISDRFSNLDNEDANSSNEFDGNAFADSVTDSPGTSVFGQIRTMSDVAIRFYKDESLFPNPNNVTPTMADINRYPGYPDDPDTLTADDELHKHIKAHMVTFGVSHNTNEQSLLEFPPNPNDAFDWRNPIDSDLGLLQDLVHAAYSGRGDYIDATDIVQASTQMQSLGQTIAAGVGTTTPPAINTQNAEGEIVIYRAFFDSTSQSGDLVAQQLNADGTLEMANGNNVFLWSAAEQLDVLAGEQGQTFSQRTIFTYSNASNDGIDFDFSDFNSFEQSQLIEPKPGGTQILGAQRVNYLKGDASREGTSFDQGEFRIRPETTSTPGVDSNGNPIVHHAKLGTIANAAPVFVGRPQAIGRFGGEWPNTVGRTYFDFQTSTSLLNRDPTVLVAANDGMLHVFDVDDGNELFAYVPSLIFNNLSMLTFPEYEHRFFVDSTPVVDDVYMRANGSSGPLDWNTIVIGGLGAGGSGYYALNITDVDPTTSATERVMWEFGPEDDPDSFIDNGERLSDLGLSFGRPLIGMSNANIGSDKKWIAVFGNGYNSKSDNGSNSTSASGNAIIYILFIDQGIDGNWDPLNDLVKIDLGANGVDFPNGISEVRGLDIDANGTIDRLYAGDLLGNLHVIDISSANSNDWDNNTFVLFEAEYSETNDAQPITTRALPVINENGPGVIVVFGTGGYFRKSDATDTNIQTLYGVIDDLTSNSVVSMDRLVDRTLTNRVFVDASTGVNRNVRTISEESAPTNSLGWFINFDAEGAAGGVEFPGEKAIRNLFLRDGVLFTNTVIPQAMSCDPAPGGFIFGIDPQTGTASTNVVFDINQDAVFNEDDKINVPGEGNVNIAGFDSDLDFPLVDLVPTTKGFLNFDSSGQSDNIPLPPIDSELLGRQSWREVEF